MNRDEISRAIVQRLEPEVEALDSAWHSSGGVAHCVLDDLLPRETALAIHAAFPSPDSMTLRSSLRECKFVAAQMNHHARLVEEAVFAFQHPRVVDLVARITGVKALEPDANLYAGGVSLMTRGHFLNPHLDNSHDKDRKRYRVLNLLYYCSPDWQHEDGGHLELWPNGPSKRPVAIESRFNRLAIMATDTRSWHSVCEVTSDKARCCVSNYYFSSAAPTGQDYFHVTSFRGRPEQPLRNVVLKADEALRMAVRKVFPHGVVSTKHVYHKDGA